MTHKDPSLPVSSKNYIAETEVKYNYYKPQHLGAKVILLTIGGVAVIGQWYGELGESFLAWAPLPKRDKEVERQIGFKEVPDDTDPVGLTD